MEQNQEKREGTVVHSKKGKESAANVQTETSNERANRCEHQRNAGNSTFCQHCPHSARCASSWLTAGQQEAPAEEYEGEQEWQKHEEDTWLDGKEFPLLMPSRQFIPPKLENLGKQKSPWEITVCGWESRLKIVENWKVICIFGNKWSVTKQNGRSLIDTNETAYSCGALKYKNNAK
jgi:hypothetical protein